MILGLATIVATIAWLGAPWWLCLLAGLAAIELLIEASK